MTAAGNGRLVLVMAGGLDWPLFVDGVRRGLLPSLDRLRARGVAAPLRAASPLSPLAACADIATGVPVDRHGIFHPQEGWEGGIRPTGRASWLAPPVWETLVAAGTGAVVVDWPATMSGADWAAAVIDPDYPSPTGADPDRWPMPPDCVPVDRRAALRDARVHPADLDAATLLPLLPRLATIDQSADLRPTHAATAMARAATVQAAAVGALGDGTGAVFVHHRWLASLRSIAGAPATPTDADEAAATAGALRFLDRLVEGLEQAAGPDATIMVVAPGLGSSGILVAAGPGIPPGMAPLAVDPRDVAPTVLATFGLYDPALPGSSLAPAATSPAPRPWPMPSPALAGPRDWQVAKLTLLAELVLPRDPPAAGRFVDAALALDANSPGALSVAAAIHVALNDPAPLAAIGDALARIAPDRHWAAMVHGIRHALAGDAQAARPWLERAAASGDGATLVRVGGAWLMLARPHEAEKAFAAARRHPDQAGAALLGMAMAARARGRAAAAEAPLRELLRAEPASAAGWSQLAAILADLGRRTEARTAHDTARRLGPGVPDAPVNGPVNDPADAPSGRMARQD